MIYSRFNPPPRKWVGGGVSMTDQSFEGESDINNIIKRFHSTGLLPQVEAGGFFEDVSMIPEDLMAAQARVAETERAFSMLPSGLRNRFNNSYISLLQFLEDPANAEEARSLGLFRKEAKPEPGAPDSGPSPG
ncbi:MAG: internal scaffolding protein [Microvirus sp.]|nr:MAG: internal scaffolding protein [Microvirus sp.]